MTAESDQTMMRYVSASTVNASTVSSVSAWIWKIVVVISGYAMTYMSDVFLTTLMYVLIEDGSAIRPPIGSVTLRKVANALESRARSLPRGSAPGRPRSPRGSSRC